MKEKFYSLLILTILVGIYTASAQVSVVSLFVNPDHVVPGSLCDAKIMNTTQKTFDVKYVAKLTNSQNQMMMQVILQHISIKPGLNSVSQFISDINLVNFGSSSQAEFIRTKYMLPSGKFKVCCMISSISGDEVNDDYCDEVESNLNSVLNLIYPYEGDTIYSMYPILIWNHNLPFEISNSNATNYRILVTKINENQSPEQALHANQPLLKQDFLRTHNVQYPFGAGKLEAGGHYAWQILEFDHAQLINKTEVWDFFIGIEQPQVPNRYGIMKATPEPGFYTVTGEMLFFKFDEQYKTEGQLVCSIYDSKRRMITPIVEDKSQKSKTQNIKRTGDNRYEINLGPYHFDDGLYMLEVKNEKSQIYYLRFMINY